jgi:hypothetical protein
VGSDFEVVIVRKSGPTQSIKIRNWWLIFFVAVMLLMGAALATGAYMFYRQYCVVAEIAEDTRLLMFRAERLEALVQEQETRELLLSQQSQDSRNRTASSATASIPVAVQADPITDRGSALTQMPADGPSRSSIVSIKNVEQSVEAGNMLISFDIVNEQSDLNPVVGYITVVAYGTRQDKPWIEAWPPMRLNSETGRPEQYKRGTPFSVQRFRTVRARMAIADKTFERLEFVLYSRQGDIMLVSSYPLTPVDYGQSSEQTQ